MSTPVVSSDIFHGLPTFPHLENEKLSVIVTGANGISGSEVVKLLAAAPQRWKTIYALSRKPPASTNKHVVPIAVDFLSSSPAEIAAKLQEHNVKADYIYFASYIQPPALPGQGLWSDTSAMTSQNLLLLTNFLSALPLASITPKRILLQTGAKYYGLHLGPTATPMLESAPRHGMEPNFYFPQEDALASYSSTNNSTYVITRPAFIWGSSTAAAMSIGYPLAVYASIQHHLNLPLSFPGNLAAWETEKHQSNAKLLARHAEWALLSPATSNKALNQSDGDVFTWGNFWPTLASWYRIAAGRPLEDSKTEDSKTEGSSAYATITLPHNPPPRGFGGPGVIKASFSLLEWSKKPEVLQAWDELSNKYGLKGSPFGDKALDTFGLLDGEISAPWPRSLSMSLNHELGWHGFVNTAESIKAVFDEMTEKHMVPPMPKEG